MDQPESLHPSISVKTHPSKKTFFYVLNLCLNNKKTFLVIFLIQVPIFCYLYATEVPRLTRDYVLQSLEGKFWEFPRSPDPNLSNSTSKAQFLNITNVKIASSSQSNLNNGARYSSTQSVTEATANLNEKRHEDASVSFSVLSTNSSAQKNRTKTTTLNYNETRTFEATEKPPQQIGEHPADEIKRSIEPFVITNSPLTAPVAPFHTEIGTTKNNTSGVKILPQCPDTPPGLQGNLFISFAKAPHSFQEVKEDNPLVLPGGYFKPPLCIANSKVAIIIPFRDRNTHLQYFLQYMHPTLQRQQLEYRIYIINQYGKGKFNRAKLMNIGYEESLKDSDFGCFVFHDVDLILENDNALYSCPDKPRHLSSAVDKFNYRLPYESIFGGVTELTRDQFEMVNGYSNSFWGWGGEDDDMHSRIRIKRMKISRYPMAISRYRMISHKREVGNEANPHRFDMIKKTPLTMSRDGLNSLKYDRHDTLQLLETAAGLIWDAKLCAGIHQY